jgi:hypothetical protein
VTIYTWGDCFDADMCVMAANCPFVDDCREVEDDDTDNGE